MKRFFIIILSVLLSSASLSAQTEEGRHPFYLSVGLNAGSARYGQGTKAPLPFIPESRACVSPSLECGVFLSPSVRTGLYAEGRFSRGEEACAWGLGAGVHVSGFIRMGTSDLVWTPGMKAGIGGGWKMKEEGRTELSWTEAALELFSVESYAGDRLALGWTAGEVTWRRGDMQTFSVVEPGAPGVVTLLASLRMRATWRF